MDGDAIKLRAAVAAAHAAFESISIAWPLEQNGKVIDHTLLNEAKRQCQLALEVKTPRPVLQRWVMDCSMMQQSVLLGIVRGPDNTPKYHPVKPVLRWYRRCLLLSALDGEVITDPYDSRGGSFTGPSVKFEDPEQYGIPWSEAMRPVVDQFFQTMDQMPIHFWLHMMHAIEIMGYKHSDRLIRSWWRAFYTRMVHAMHVYPETEEQLDSRLGDTREGWLERSDPAITK